MLGRLMVVRSLRSIKVDRGTSVANAAGRFAQFWVVESSANRMCRMKVRFKESETAVAVQDQQPSAFSYYLDRSGKYSDPVVT